VKVVSVKFDLDLYGELKAIAERRGFTNLGSFIRQAMRNEIGRDELHKVEDRLVGMLNGISTRERRHEEQLDALYQLLQGRPLIPLPEDPTPAPPVQLPIQLLTEDPSEAQYIANIQRITEKRRNGS
jgi:hypothetical protein